MKEEYSMTIRNILFAALTTALLLPCATVKGQSIYKTKYASVEITHKTGESSGQNKWIKWRTDPTYSISKDAKDMDTFDDNTKDFTNPFNKRKMQPAHEYIDTIYVVKGQSVTLTLPLVRQGFVANDDAEKNKASARNYQRWYNYITDGTFKTQSTNRSNQHEELLTFDVKNHVYIFKNGYVGGTSVDNTEADVDVETDKNTPGPTVAQATFYFPTDNDNLSLEGGNGGKDYYVVACDASGYNDEVNNTSNTQSPSFEEPTISLRCIYYIVAVENLQNKGNGTSDDKENDWNGYRKLINDDDYHGWTSESISGASDKKFLEEYDITFPCNHLCDVTDELVALSKAANAYGVPGDDASTGPAVLKATISSPENQTNKYVLFSDVSGGNASTLESASTIYLRGSYKTEDERYKKAGSQRVISFRQFNAAKNSKGKGYGNPWIAADGDKATITVTKIVNDITYNIARFNITFKQETRLLTQHELDRIDQQRAYEKDNTSGNAQFTKTGENWSESWYKPVYQKRTPKYLRENYKLLTELTFDYDKEVPGKFNSGEKAQIQQGYYPFPIKWGYSSYAFFDGSTKDNFRGASETAQGYTTPIPEWGNYSITYDYIGYGDKNHNNTHKPTQLGSGGRFKNNPNATEEEGYFLYVDASDHPGMIATVPFRTNLCPGAELFVSAWVKGADYEDYSKNPPEIVEKAAMLFTIYGVKLDGTRVPLYRQSTGQIQSTSFLTTKTGDSKADMYAEYTSTNGYGLGQNDWYQIYFSFINESSENNNFDSYELKVDNNCASTSGGDFYLDNIEVYISRPVPTVTQKEAVCSGERTLLTASLDWFQLCTRIGADPDKQSEKDNKLATASTTTATTTTTTNASTPEGIDFCFIDVAKYEALINNGTTGGGVGTTGGSTTPSDDQIAQALEKAHAVIGSGKKDEAGQDEGPNFHIATLYWQPAFEDNSKYSTDKQNLAKENTGGTSGADTKYFFYRTGDAETETRRLIVDFYSDMAPNKRYWMLIRDHEDKTESDTVSFADFVDAVRSTCGIKSEFSITSQTLIKINGDVVDPTTDLCKGQTFNFTATMRKPQMDGDQVKTDADGNTVYEDYKGTVYFDWFFGTGDEFYAATGDNTPKDGPSLQSALYDLRAHYPDVDEQSFSTVTAISDNEPNLTDDDINLIKSYLNADATSGVGALNKRLVLHKTDLDIAILTDELNIVLDPIPVKNEGDDGSQGSLYCWEPVTLTLKGSGDSPRLSAGFNSTMYPDETAQGGLFYPALRIGLDQIQEAKYVDPSTPTTGSSSSSTSATTEWQGKTLNIRLRKASYTKKDNTVDHLGLASTSSVTAGGVDYTQIYLTATDDPQYTAFLENDGTIGGTSNKYKLPIGKIQYLFAKDYSQVANADNVAKIQFYLDQETSVPVGGDSKKFKFDPREGYTYTFSVNFAEYGSEKNADAASDGVEAEEKEGTKMFQSSCWGEFPITMKVVPKYLVWQGGAEGATKNWNKDENWKRADQSDLHIESYSTSTNSATSDEESTVRNDYANYESNEDNFGKGNEAKGFVPMLFSNVVMPKDSRAQLYMAGYKYANKETGTNAEAADENKDTWGTDKPENMENPTENIQYDLMAYDDPSNKTAVTTEHYRVNLCRDIHFAPDAQMLHAEQLIYNKAWVDVPVAPNQWTLVSSPLQDTYAGDWYTNSSDGSQAEEPYFLGLKFDESKNDRLNPAVYQRSWTGDAKIVEQTTTGGTGGSGSTGTTTTPVSFQNAWWSSVYNDASVPYSPGQGFSVKGVKKANDGATTMTETDDDAEQPLVFRLPKADEKYVVSTNSSDLNKENAGKLLISGMVDRSTLDSYQEEDKQKVTATLTPSADGQYMIVGNPFMAPLNVKSFLSANSDKLAQEYWLETDKGPVVGAAESGNWVETKDDTNVTIPPYGAFFVKKVSPSTNTLLAATETEGVEVKFTANMQQWDDDKQEATGASETDALKITAANKAGRSGAVLVYSPSADNGYEASEDAELVSGLTGEEAAVPMVYTVAGATAASVNRVKDAAQVPLGVFAADGEPSTLTFTGTDALPGATLYDAEMNTSMPLSEGYTLTVDGPSQGRYFLRTRSTGSSTAVETTDDKNGGVGVYSAAPGQLTVYADRPLLDVMVYGVSGTRLANEAPGGDRSTCTLHGLTSGVAIVKVTTAEGTTTHKVMVR